MGNGIGGGADDDDDVLPGYVLPFHISPYMLQ